MNLTKAHKTSMVHQIMRDIPEVDYGKLIEELVQTEALKLFPAEAQALYANPETRGYLACASLSCSTESLYHIGYVYFPRAGTYATGGHRTIYLTRRHFNSDTDELVQKLLAVVWSPVQEHVRKAEAQFKDRRSMKQKLETMFAGIRTLKQAKTMLEPELHKYLPEEPAKTEKAAQASVALVPYVVANLREMGWPKTEEAA